MSDAALPGARARAARVPPTTPRPTRAARTLLLLLSGSIGACGGAPTGPRTLPVVKALRSIPEARAIKLIDGWLTESAWIGRPGWVVNLSQHAQLEVDLRLGTADFGIEWISAEDREHYGAALPSPDPSGQIRLLHAIDGAQVLILDHETYRAAPTTAVDRSVVLSEEEVRLRRDVLDFVTYVESQ